MRIRLILLLLLLTLASACTLSTAFTSQNTLQLPTATIEVEVTEESTPEATVQVVISGAIGPINFPADVNPLTGLTVSDPSVLNRRPIITKISNAPPLVRPQSGISEADLVFEHYAEGGLTRFSAIFYSNAPTRVGSIRSARLIDYELVPMYQGMLAFAGASPGVEKRIYGSDAMKSQICGGMADAERIKCETDFDAVGPVGDIPASEFADRAYKGIFYGQPYYWRDETIPVPHNLFTNIQALWELAASESYAQRPTLTGMSFHPDAPAGESGTGNALEVRYRTTLVRWIYDPTTGLYARFSDGQGHYDANTQRQITAANVVVIYAGHYTTDIVESMFENNVSWSWQITLWPEGDAILLRDGKRYDARWIRAVREDLISLETKDGEILYLKPGNTWFQVVQLPEQQNLVEEWVKVE